MFYHGPFSQWYPAKFEIDGVTYNCAEQYMMAKKALLFNDVHTHKKIMDSDNPSQQKKFGRLVNDFDRFIWESVAKDIVLRGNLAKFSQNDNLLISLAIASDDYNLVEASPYDKVWGVGLSQDNPDAFDPNKWKGKNWLGEILVITRQYLTK